MKIIRLTESELINIIRYVITEETDVSTENEISINNLPLQRATSLIGVPYKWGGVSPNGIDCSGLIYYSFKNFGLSRTNANGYFNSPLFKKVETNKLIPGDLIFFGPSGVAKHVGIINTVGSGGNVTSMIHAKGGQKCPGNKTTIKNGYPHCVVERTTKMSWYKPVIGYRRFKYEKNNYTN